MLRKILVVLCLLMCLAGAEMPKVGDEVSITQSIGVMGFARKVRSARKVFDLHVK